MESSANNNGVCQVVDTTKKHEHPHLDAALYIIWVYHPRYGARCYPSAVLRSTGTPTTSKTDWLIALLCTFAKK